MQTIGQALREAQLAFVVGTVTLVAGALCAGPALGFDRDCESTGSWHVCTWELLGQTVSAEATVRRVHKGRRGAKMAFQCSESSIGGKRFRHRHVTLQWGPTPASHVARGPLDTKVSIDGRPPETLRWTATEYEQNEDYETLVDVSHRANAGEWTPCRFYKVILSSAHRRCPLSRKSHEIGHFLSIQQVHLRAFGPVSQAHL